jgi:hypothetical protein
MDLIKKKMVIVMECHEIEIIITIQSHIYYWMEKMRLQDLTCKIIQIYQEFQVLQVWLEE